MYRMSAAAESSVDNLATSFGMDDPAQETRIVRQLKREANARVIDQFGGLDLVQVCHTIFAVGSNGLTYFVKWEDCKDAILPGRRCIRIAVWRLYAPPGLGRHIFHRHVLPVCGAVVADAKQMRDADRYWGDQVGEALNRGFCVWRVKLAE